MDKSHMGDYNKEGHQIRRNKMFDVSNPMLGIQLGVTSTDLKLFIFKY